MMKYVIQLVDNEDYCQKNFINDCETLLNIYKGSCDFNGELDCKEVYENPLKFIKKCQIVKWFKNDFEMFKKDFIIEFNISEENYKYYEEKCLSLSNKNNTNIN
ncbi:hypothetical protein BCR32DRAFT_282135 [Anaeromyces robustus]|uniref:Uncharacterized protein n=1 Tax=Anaeromyces robustus TaxID=1754192 RepID=A0A1Y1WZQ3_9FUNG|nr:hypothetical protein BCR32DRAFT_282135 [Anaeromyces robustus]|eukprot:ORX78574.1 hypothetical protein BCR32DRAFT_282135 [Anaeromyces robustus]